MLYTAAMPFNRRTETDRGGQRNRMWTLTQPPVEAQ